jgi:hypothetical protein
MKWSPHKHGNHRYARLGNVGQKLLERARLDFLFLATLAVALPARSGRVVGTDNGAAFRRLRRARRRRLRRVGPDLGRAMAAGPGGATVSLSPASPRRPGDASGHGDPSWKDLCWDVHWNRRGRRARAAIDLWLIKDHAEPGKSRGAFDPMVI